MSKKQELARARNFMRFRLTGFVLGVNPGHVTWEESQLIHDFERARMDLLDNFNKNSRELGLKVPEHRCYYYSCRNKAKFEGELHGEEFHFCKKHYQEYLECKI